MPIGSLIGGALGVASNLLTNAQNQSNFENSMNWQKFQYEDMKRYNRASQQVLRLRAAGINPSLAFGSDTGSAQATTSPSAPTLNPLDMNGLAAIGDNLEMNATRRNNLVAQTEKTEQETKGLQTDNAFKAEDWLSKLYNRDADSWYKDQMSKNVKLGNEYLFQTMKDRVWQAKMESQRAQAEAYAQNYLLPYVPLKAQAEIDNLAANTKMAYDMGAASLTQALAALTQSEVAKQALFAQFGDSPEARRNWYHQSLKFLTAQTGAKESEEFKNYSFEQNTPYPAKRAQYDKKSKKWNEVSVENRKPIFRYWEW